MNRIRSQAADQQDLPLPGGSPMEGIGAELQQRQQELIHLQRQQQELEQRKRQLEELNSRRMELIDGQREIRDRLVRAVVILERAEGQGRKEVQEMYEARQIFSEQLSGINDINPTEWAATDIEEELSKALAKVDQAQAIYTQSRAKLDALRGRDLEPDAPTADECRTQSSTTASESFIDNLQRGFAFNLPLIIAILIGLGIFRLLK